MTGRAAPDRSPPSNVPAERRTPPSRPLALGLVVLALAVLGAAILLRHRTVTTSHYLLLAVLLFTIGVGGVLMRRNALVLFMCVELMLNAVNLAFVAFARMHNSMDGQVIVLFVMIVAAAEVAVGLAIIVSIFRSRLSANVDDLSLLRW